MTNEVESVQIPTAQSFFKGIPWILLIFVFAFLSWSIWEPFFTLFMPASSAQFASIGVSTIGAYAVCFFAMADNWPFHGIRNKWARGVALIILSQAVAVILWLILGGVFKLDLQAWAFPIIANLWLILAATSFVGADAHLQGIPPVRRAFLNLVIAVGCMLVMIRTLIIVPAYWFTILQTFMVTGAIAYYFRRVKQPVFSLLAWPFIFGLTWLALVVASWFGLFTLGSNPTAYWTWNLGEGTAEFGILQALSSGLNFSVFAIIQGWPFSRIKQPWATPIAFVAMLFWCYLLTQVVMAVFQSLAPGEGALWQAQIMGWHTVFWGFAWVYAFGIGQTPFLWAGQKTPGTWDDVE